MYNIEYYNLDSKNKNDQLLIDTAKSVVSSINSDNPYYRIFKKQESYDALQDCAKLAKKIKDNFSDIIVISMGGAALNPQMLISFLGQNKNSPKIHFLNNTDPIFFADLMSIIDVKNSAFIAISNSGNTLETNSLVGCVIREYEQNNITDLDNRSFFITNLKNGTLKDIANEIGGTLIAHQEGISGRYCGLSSVSLLIGLIADIDMLSYLSGANKVIDDFCTNLAESKPLLSASSIYYSNKTILVNIGYLQRFLPFLEWYSQIIAESLGKDGKGYTPLKGLGPNDQHSMLQLYLDGPKDKYFTFFYINEIKQTPQQYKTSKFGNLTKLEYLANRQLSEINKANFDATISALNLKELPIRSIILKDLSAQSLGAIICHSMFEIITISHLMQINPFDQPGVEMIKKYSKMLVTIAN